MEKIVISGGKPLNGEIPVSGFKNAAVAIVLATILTEDKCIIENLPQISDVTLLLSILRDLGANIRSINLNTVEIDCTHVRNAQIPMTLPAAAVPPTI